MKITVYKNLCDRLINYMSKIFDDASICIVDPKKHDCLVLFIDGPYGFTKWEGSYESIYNDLTTYGRDQHVFRSSYMSPEEVELQLAIRGY